MLRFTATSFLAFILMLLSIDIKPKTTHPKLNQFLDPPLYYVDDYYLADGYGSGVAFCFSTKPISGMSEVEFTLSSSKTIENNETTYSFNYPQQDEYIQISPSDIKLILRHATLANPSKQEIFDRARRYFNKF